MTIQRIVSYVCCIGMGLVGVFLAEAAYAVNIPPIPEVSSAVAALHPELVQRRAALRLERDQLHDRTISHNSECGSVEEGSSAEASCTSQREALSAAVDRHVQASTQFIEDYKAAEAERIQDTGLHGLRTGTTVTPNTDPMVVDARNVPSGLPKSVDDAIPHTPAGERVRKGFQAVQDGDWKVALAWFKDAHNKEPNNPGIARLVDLAQFTLDYRTRAPTPATGKNASPTQSPNQNTSNQSAKAAETKPANGVEQAAASQIAARARADAAFKQYVEKYGERDAVGRASAGAKAARGDGYSNEELKAQLQQALKDYRAAHKKQGSGHDGSVGGSPTADEIIVGEKG